MRPLQDLDAQVFVGDADRARRHRHEAVTGHAGRRIYLQEVGLAGLRQHQVDADPAVAADELERLQRERLQRPFLRRCQSGRAVVFRVIGEVLVLVVVAALRRGDANEGQRRVVDDARGVLRTVDEWLIRIAAPKGNYDYQ